MKHETGKADEAYKTIISRAYREAMQTLADVRGLRMRVELGDFPWDGSVAITIFDNLNLDRTNDTTPAIVEVWLYSEKDRRYDGEKAILSAYPDGVITPQRQLCPDVAEAVIGGYYKDTIRAKLAFQTWWKRARKHLSLHPALDVLLTHDPRHLHSEESA